MLRLAKVSKNASNDLQLQKSQVNFQCRIQRRLVGNLWYQKDETPNFLWDCFVADTLTVISSFYTYWVLVLWPISICTMYEQYQFALYTSSRVCQVSRLKMSNVENYKNLLVARRVSKWWKNPRLSQRTRTTCWKETRDTTLSTRRLSIHHTVLNAGTIKTQITHEQNSAVLIQYNKI